MGFLSDYKKTKKKMDKIFGVDKKKKAVQKKKTGPTSKSRTFSIKTKLEILPGASIEIWGTEVELDGEVVGTVSDAAETFIDESDFPAVFEIIEKNKVKITIECEP